VLQNTDQPDTSQREYVQLLRLLLRSGLDASSLETLVTSTVVLGERILRWLSSGRRYYLVPVGIPVGDLAYDLLAELLSGEGNDTCASLREGLLSICGPDADDAELLSAMDALLLRTIHQQMARVLAESDPVSSRLLHSLRQQLRANDDCGVIDRIDGRWLFRKDIDPLIERPACPLDTLRQLLRSLPNERSSVRRVLLQCFEVLADQEEYRRAVLELDVVRLGVDLIGRDFAALETTSTTQASRHVYDVQLLQRIMYDVVEEHRGWLEEKFLRKAAFTEGEIEAMLAAIRLYLEDAAIDETQHYYTYLRRCLPGLSQQRYREHYKNRFEYICRKILDEIWRKWAKINESRGAA
jgi:hypothetical protein